MNVITNNDVGAAEKHLGIADVSDLTGMSQDTLRWYEKEGIIPPFHAEMTGADSTGRHPYASSASFRPCDEPECQSRT